MSVENGSWHFRLFGLGLMLIAKFIDQPWYGKRFERKTNLCHYMRVILVYAPLIIILYGLTAAGGIAVCIALPIRLFGISGYLWTLGIIAAIVTAIALVILGVAGIVELVRWARQRAIRRASQKSTRVFKEERVSPGFLELVANWLKAKKQKICPQLTFIGAESREGAQ